MNELLNLLIISLLVMLISSCSNINYEYTCIKTYEKNPTSYLFNQNVNTIRQILIEKKNEIQQVFCPYYKESLKSKEIFVDDFGTKFFCTSDFYFKAPKENDSIGLWSDTNNRTIYFKSNGIDIFLACAGWFHSEVCFNNNDMPVDMQSNFLIHFEIIDCIKTKIEVIAIYPEIETGLCKYCGSGFSDMAIFSPTEATTIEGYKILLKIGELLGEEDEMPKIKIPKRPSKND
ncbi:MAG: hypothetical protein RO257_10115 [Candidatus Kapabacteria bacterium]|nr:hypothetical protein [Candidatus Kapabacteria bacterium]